MAVGGKWIFKGGKWVFERIKSKFKKPVKVEVKKLPQGATVSERSKKYMGQSVQDEYKKTIASSRTKSDVKDIFKDADNFGRSKATNRNRGGKISGYYKKGGNVITGR